MSITTDVTKTYQNHVKDGPRTGKPVNEEPRTTPQCRPETGKSETLYHCIIPDISEILDETGIPQNRDIQTCTNTRSLA